MQNGFYTNVQNVLQDQQVIKENTICMWIEYWHPRYPLLIINKNMYSSAYKLKNWLSTTSNIG